jgi:tetratricopeptide (TPR) repeat protein
MRAVTVIAAVCAVLCCAFSTSARGPADRTANSLIQTAAQQFENRHDSAGAESCLKIYDLDNIPYRQYLINAGEGFERAGIKARAKKAYAEYIEKYGADPRAVSRLAILEYGDKYYGRVVELLTKIPLQVASQEQLCMILAASHNELGQYDKSVALLSQPKYQKNRQALELLALSSERLHDYSASLSCYERLLAFAPAEKKTEYVFRMGQVYEEMGQKDKAKECYQKNLAEYRPDLRNHERLATLLLQDRLFQPAQQLLEKAMGVPGASPVFKKMMGQSLAEQGNRLAAVNWYRQYLEAVPDDSTAWCELGSVYFQQEHYQEAVEALKKSVALQPQNAECLIMLGTCYGKINEMDSAVVPLETARTINKYDIRVLSQLAAYYRLKRDSKKVYDVLKDWTVADPKNSQPKFELGDMYVWDQKYRDAIPVLESACGLDSTNVQAHLSLAKAYEKTGNDAGRLLHLKMAVTYGSRNADAQYEYGRFYGARNQLAYARPFLAKAISLDASKAATHFEYGRLLSALGEKDSALEQFNIALQAEPQNIAFLVQFAQAAHAVGRKEVALENIVKALARDSTNTEILQWAGILYRECGFDDTAKQILLKAITLDKDCASCCKYLADIYRTNADYDLAVKFYRQALAVGSFSEGASMGLGVSLFLSGDLDRARMMFEKIFSENPKGDESLYRLCSVYIRMDMLDNAKEIFTRSRGGRKSAWILLTEGEIAEAEDKPDDALASYTAATSLMPENPLAHAGAGRINLVKKQFDKAAENFGNALGRDAHNVDFLLGMGKAYEGMGQSQAAFDLYTEVAKKSPRNPEVFYVMGRALSKQKEHDKAVTTLLHGLDLSPKNAALYYGLGYEYRALSKFKEAVEAFKKSVSNKNDEKRYIDAYKNIGNIYYYDLKDQGKAKDFFNKYIKAGGKDEKVNALLNNSKN